MSNALVPFNELESMASYIVKSRLFGAKDESQAMSLMLLAQAEGCHPMSAVQDFDIVQGRPARKTHSILARFQAAGGCVAWEEITGTRACGVFSHPRGGSLRVEWTFEQARKVGLTGKDNWKNYPQAMLRARCIAEGVRAVFPGAIGGLLSVEEAQDIVVAPPRNMGAVEQVAGEPPSALMGYAEGQANMGTHAFREFWKSLAPADRESLKPAIAALKARAEEADKPAADDSFVTEMVTAEATA